MSFNRNKRSLSLNLKSPKGIEIAKKLVKTADVLLENQIAGKLDKLGLGYEACKAVKGDIIYCSVTGFGQDGPYRTNPGYDSVVGAESGILFATGEPDRSPSRPGIAVTDLLAGHNACQSILASLLGRARTGKGARIDVSMFDSQVIAVS